MKSTIKTQTFSFLELFEKFIKSSRNGKRHKKNGSKIRASTIKNYLHVKNLLLKFSEQKKVELRIKSYNKLTKREMISEKNYWKSFYKKFTDFLYHDLNYFDNTVGNNVKIIRAFFSYLNDDLGLSTGTYYKKFYVSKEEIEIVTLSPEKLNYLISDKTFEDSLDEKLRRIKDVFVFGCTVALRVSDLLSLNKTHLEQRQDALYLKTYAHKTNVKTTIKLPDYCIRIINKYSGKYKTLLPKMQNVYLNKGIKQLMEKAEWTSTYSKSRGKRGVPYPINKVTNLPYRFCDLITSHTMRRTAISTMLCLGMPEQYVRKISGHTAGSKEFFRYVEFSQKYIDHETDKVFEMLNTK